MDETPEFDPLELIFDILEVSEKKRDKYLLAWAPGKGFYLSVKKGKKPGALSELVGVTLGYNYDEIKQTLATGALFMLALNDKNLRDAEKAV